MSGFEIAGVVLGAFPIIISGLQGYAQGCEAVGDMLHYQEVLKDFIRELEMERTKFSEVCYHILDDVQTMPDDLQAQYLRADFWKLPVVQCILEKHLKPAPAAAFAEGAVKTNDVLQALGKKFPKLENRKSSKYNRNLRQRFNLSMLKKYRQEQIQCLRNINDDLRTLVFQPVPPIAPRRRPTQQDSKALSYFKRVREQTSILYDALSKRFGSSCVKCSAAHEAGLELGFGNPRNSRTSIRIKCAFPVEPQDEKMVSWREVELEPINCNKDACSSEDEDISTCTTTMFKRKCEFGSKEDEATGQTAKPQKEKKKFRFSRIVRFQTSKALSASSASSIACPDGRGHGALSPVSVSESILAAPVALIQLSHSENSTIVQVEDLCQAIKKENTPDLGFGILSIASNIQHRIWPSSDNPGLLHCGTTRLNALLCDGRRGGLSVKDRLQVGFKLASSLLQLYHTSWLPESWTSGDIVFLRHEILKSNVEDHILVDKPLVKHQFPLKTPQTSQPHRTGYRRNKSLYSLGVVLAELWSDLPLARLQAKISGEGGLHEGLLTRDDEEALIDWICRQSPETYGHVVRRCIEGLDVRYPDFSDHEFRNKVYQLVLKPLKEVLSEF